MEHALVLAIVLLSLIAKLRLLEPLGPVVFFDEMLYRQGAEAIAHLGHYPGGQYPFGYPALIAPAFALGFGYAGAVVINIIATTALIPACYLLARSVQSRHALLAAIVAALLPIHAAMPTQLLSENAFIPAFAFVVWFAVRGRCSSVPSAIVFGMALGFLFLVKYLALPSIPVLWAIWLIGMRANLSSERTRPLLPVPRAALASVAGIGVVVASWVFYAHANDIALLKASTRISGIHTSAISAASILMWVCVYTAAATLLAGPFIGPLMYGARAAALEPGPFRGQTPMTRLVWTTLILSAGYVLVAALHSAGAGDNYPVPQRVISRYLMMLTPLFVVLGTANAAIRPSGWTAIRSLVLALLAAAVVVAAHGVLYDNAVWSFPAWFATIPQYSSDTVGYASRPMLLFLAATAALGAFAWMHRALWMAWALGVVILFSASLSVVDQHSKETTTVRPMHARMLAHVVLKALQSNESVVVVSDIKSERPPVMGQALMFWGVPKRRIKVVGYPRLRDVPLDTGVPVFLITGRHLPTGLVLQYRYGSRDGFIYRLDRTPAPPTVPAQSD